VLTVTEGALGLDPRFLAAIADVPASAWSLWFGRTEAVAQTAPASVPSGMVAAFALPASAGLAAICIFETRTGSDVILSQAALRRWNGAAPAGAQILFQHTDGSGNALWTLASAWADANLCRWLREALSAGASMRANGWEWLAAPERPAVSSGTDGSSRQLPERRHDVVLLPPGAVAIVYRELTRGGQPELELLRHLERVPGIRLAPSLLGAAVVLDPEGRRSASAMLEDIDPAAATVRSVLVSRLRRALDGDPSLQAVALDDVRAVGGIARELHAALGRPFDMGVLRGAAPATEHDVEIWVARTWGVLTAATRAVRTSHRADAARLAPALEVLPGRLQQFAAAAKRAPGLAHRTHGNLRLDTVLIAPPRRLSVVEFDGDASLSDADRVAPQSPWRDVARLLVSLTDAAAEAATLVGGDTKAFEIAWLWEREARKACLEGYGTGGGALHALLAIFEMESAARHLLTALAAGPHASLAVSSHTLQRLTRTVA
jgi:predicted trehalose synthase